MKTVSGLLGLVLNHLKVQDIINAKAAAIKESIECEDESWVSIYYRDHLADPACHYEPALLKVPARDFDDLIDEVDAAFMEIIQGTPAILLGKLMFVDALPTKRAMIEFPGILMPSATGVMLSIKNGRDIYVLIPSGEEMYIYIIEEVSHK
jgi:hypothetical protein